MTFRTMTRPLLGALLTAALLAPIPGHAQSTPPPIIVIDAHTDLFDAINAGVDQEQMLDTMIRQVAAQIVVSLPEGAQMEAQAPGLLLELMLALRPVLRDYQDRIRQQYNPQIIAEMRQVFTSAEAAQLAEFYRSDLGLRAMSSFTSNVSLDQSIDLALGKQDVTADALAADAAVSVNRTVGAMISSATPEELEAMATLPQRLPAIMRMPELHQRTLPIRTAMENEPPTPAEQQAIEQGIAEAFAKYLEREHS